jgi:uncharacterized protein YlxW (UPF0749 family)
MENASIEVIKEAVESYKEVANVMKETNATGVIKEAAKAIFSGLTSLFKSKSKKNAVEALESNPDDAKVSEKLEAALQDAITDEEFQIADLKAELDKLKNFIAEHKPEVQETINARVQNSKNVVIGAKIGNIGGNFIVGDGHSVG